MEELVDLSRDESDTTIVLDYAPDDNESEGSTSDGVERTEQGIGGISECATEISAKVVVVTASPDLDGGGSESSLDVGSDGDVASVGAVAEL
ncbi:hypothetical protein L917_15852 [Phytophthora nicotianae]|uniref:Uncharacterized protein n=1 Tax=Phytophthora nicotianae TaxID=4792 RepID=W2KGL9_PHYNI|nr:hypothetical protein L917_15852 [Phytophthora nicotianae]